MAENLADRCNQHIFARRLESNLRWDQRSESQPVRGFGISDHGIEDTYEKVSMQVSLVFLLESGVGRRDSSRKWISDQSAGNFWILDRVSGLGSISRAGSRVVMGPGLGFKSGPV
ncbi:hypothetical protein HAX54_020132 [Datura stramonium]|uniref:Uncharacterized protein n=1 Tax=Datura stramonium TaxID=4076 RepID=A0ABS8USP4_DATST|nr:hypothetical protein [Datura stramonium]